MRGLTLALALAATTALASSAAAEPAAIFRILELKGSAVKWGHPALGTGAHVTYGFVDSRVDFRQARNCRAMVPMDALLAKSGIDRAMYESETAKAFEAWSSVADIEFRRVADIGQADILIGAQAHPLGRAFTNVAYERPATRSVRPISRSLVCLNPDELWKVGFDGDLDVYDLRYTLAHEIGHAIGLDHPSAAGQVMSYRYEEQFDTLQPGDISGVVALYGSAEKLMARSAESQPVSGDDAAGPILVLESDQQTRALP